MSNPSYSTLYQQHRSAALSIPEAEVEPYRASPRVVLVNLKLGHKSLLGTPELVARAAEHLPKLPWGEIQELPDLGRALIYASGKVVIRATSTGEIEAKLAEIREPREQMLAQAEVLAKRGKLDPDVVAKLRAGSGKYDTASDVVGVVGLFMENAADLAGLHPFTVEEMEKAREAAEWLMERLVPEGAKGEPGQKPEATRVRDGLWTMIVRRHALLRKAGSYFHGEEVDTYVPRLMSRVAPAALAEKEPEEGEAAGGEE
jgi:hypothetical protein